MRRILALASIGQGVLGAVTDCAAARFRCGVCLLSGRRQLALPGVPGCAPVGAENLRHLGRCFAERRRLGHANGAWRAGLGSGWRAMIFGLWA